MRKESMAQDIYKNSLSNVCLFGYKHFLRMVRTNPQKKNNTYSLIMM
jgi:hypothetical protein